MYISEKEKMLKEMLESISKTDEKDRSAILAYIQGTIDTRERIKNESTKIESV